MNEPKHDFDITIGLVVHNEVGNLGGVLESFGSLNLNQLKVELILVDNASTDGSVQAMREFVESHRGVLSVRLVERQKNHLGEARQDVVQLANSPLIAFTDCDCRPDKGWLDRLYGQFVEKQKTHKRLAGLGSLARFKFEGFRETSWRVLAQTFLGHFNSTQMKAVGEPKEVSHIPTANIIYSKEAILSVGGFSSDFPRVCEDVDLNNRLVNNSFALIFAPEPEVHHIGPQSLKSWFQKIFIYGLGQAKIFRTHKEARELRFILPMLFLPCLGLLVLTAFFNQIALILLLSYFAILFLVSFIGHLSLGSVHPISILYTWGLFLITHVSYSGGFLRGMIFGTAPIDGK